MTHSVTGIGLIDSTRRRPGVRHIATIDSTGVAHTACGRVVKYYFSADNVSWFYTDGTRYSRPCRHCLPAEYELQEKLNEPLVFEFVPEQRR